MAATKQPETIFETLARLRSGVTERGIELLRGERFAEAQALTQIGQELKEVELRLGGLLRNGTSPAPATAAAAAPAAPRTAKPYPRYVRQGEILVKIGQRRDRKGTYEQKLAKTEFDEIANALRRVLEAHPEFEAGDVIQAVRLPSYQIYLFLGFLQEHGLLDSPSRGRYRISNEQLGRVANAWELAGTRS